MKLATALMLVACACAQAAFFREPHSQWSSDLDRHLERLDKAMSASMGDSRCDPCPSGFGVEVECDADAQPTVCKKCATGTFAGPFSHHDKCRTCQRCGDGLYEKTACSPHKDAECAACAELLPTINRDYINKCLRRDSSRDWPNNNAQHEQDPFKEQRRRVEQAIEEKINPLMWNKQALDDEQSESIDLWLVEREDDKDVMAIVDRDYQDANAPRVSSESSSSSSSSEEDDWDTWWKQQTDERRELSLDARRDYSARMLAQARRLLQLLMATKVLVMVLCLLTALSLCLCCVKAHARRSQPKTRVILSTPNLARYNPLKGGEVPYGRLNEVESDAVRNSARAQVQTHRWDAPLRDDDANEDKTSQSYYYQAPDRHTDDDDYVYQPTTMRTVVNPLSDLPEKA